MGHRRHIELFAGCGGLALGMEKAGFELLLANELSPMAAETFAYNILNEDLSISMDTARWLSSKYPKESIKRLRENPFDALFQGYHDISGDTILNGKLIIGDVRQLKGCLESYPELVDQLSDVDVLSGGPPCQGFSLAGLRRKNDYKNSLPLSFAQLAGIIQPKIVLLENVKGITSAFKENGEDYYAWLEVSKAFRIEGFAPICFMTNSKHFGVPQNRPRFIMIAIRSDLFNKSKELIHPEIWGNTKSFMSAESDVNKEGVESFKYFDIADYKDQHLFDGRLFPSYSQESSKERSVYDAINDLVNSENESNLDSLNSDYARELNTVFPNPSSQIRTKLSNHEERGHDDTTRARFRYYQLIASLNGKQSEAESLIKPNVELSEKKEVLQGVFSNAFQGETVLFSNGDTKRIKTLADFKIYLGQIPSTKKHSQRALRKNEPAPAQLTIPDDVCHYDSSQQRTLTVREMARIQSFPDWFEFKSKVTTGGHNRQFEVPQYTQVGNAVPPLLAMALGLGINNFLNEYERTLNDS